MNNNNYCIIMAGGVGSRFWPLSRNAYPKQFLDILDLGKSFLQLTFERFANIVPAENIIVVTAEQYEDLVKKQLPQISRDNVLLEPYKRNTAPCIVYATYKLLARNPDATVVVAPSDHFITGEVNFQETISCALEYASKSNDLFTVGIKPTRADTNYGYIQINKGDHKIINEHSAYSVKTFTEKPNAELAKVFLETGEFFWNSGMFIWNLKAIKNEMEKYLPEVTELFKGGEEYYYTPQEVQFIQKVYADCPAISIDYGVMEKTKKAWVFLSNFGWSDVGTWNSIYERSPNKDLSGNIIKADEAMIDNVTNTIVQVKNKEKLVVVRNLDNFMVVDTDDVLLVCPKSDQAVKDIVTDLGIKEKSKYL